MKVQRLGEVNFHHFRRSIWSCDSCATSRCLGVRISRLLKLEWFNSPELVSFFKKALRPWSKIRFAKDGWNMQASVGCFLNCKQQNVWGLQSICIFNIPEKVCMSKLKKVKPNCLVFSLETTTVKSEVEAEQNCKISMAQPGM